MGTVTNKVAFITGGADGIGAATARQLVSEGAKVGLVDVNASKLEALVAELGPSAHGVVGDVTDQAGIEAAAAEVVERFGGIDIVVANAGIGAYGTVLGIDPEAFARVIDINLTGVFRTVRAALPSVIERKGYVLVVCSLASFAHSPGMASYNASKAGAEHFANVLRLEVAHHGVGVGSAHMSWIDTPLVRNSEKDLGAFRKMRDALPGPMGGTTTVEDCAAAFVAGIKARKKRVWVPGWVSVFFWIRSLLPWKLSELEQRKQAPTLLPQMDAEVEALGRSLQEAAVPSAEARAAAREGDPAGV